MNMVYNFGYANTSHMLVHDSLPEYGRMHGYANNGGYEDTDTDHEWAKPHPPAKKSRAAIPVHYRHLAKGPS